MRPQLGSLQLLLALAGGLLARRARRAGPAWSALVLLLFLSSQVTPGAAARLPQTRGAAALDVAAASIAVAAASVPAACARPVGAGPVPAGSRQRAVVRSLLCRELPPPRAPDRQQRRC